MYRAAWCVVGIVALSLWVNSPAEAGGANADVKPVKITVILRGAISSECAEALKKAMKSVEHIRFDEDAIQPVEKGKFGHYFTPPVWIEFLDVDKTDLGAVAKAIAEAKTPKRGEQPPSLNLILYNSKPFERGHVVNLRETFGEIPGFDARATGGTGAFPDEGTLRLRLDGSNAAKISEIVDHLRRADLPFTLQK